MNEKAKKVPNRYHPTPKPDRIGCMEATTISSAGADVLAYGVEGLARATDVSQRTIRAAISRGDLRAVKVGRRVLVLRDDALRWLGCADR